MAGPADPLPARVRPHVAAAAGRAQHVLLDFDGVMFNVQDALGLWAREQAIAELLRNRPHRPRPVAVTLGWDGVHPTMAFLAEREPDYAVEAETIVSTLEMDAALTAGPAFGLRELLAACAATGRKVAAVSDMCEPAVLATLRAHGLNGAITAVAGRQGLDLSTIDPARTTERAADLLDAQVNVCLLVSGNSRVLRAARTVDAIGLGCECGRGRRKHLAAAEAPVVSGLPTLTAALLTRAQPDPGH
jgi:beta-phosphoglucomutase-like phosphatase (HAD superfamily)